MKFAWRLVLAVVLVALAAGGFGFEQRGLAKPAPSPSPSPTTPPTPYMPPDQATNGIWDVIMQGAGSDITYSTLKLKDDGDKVSGVWLYDKKTVYVVAGTRAGTHLSLKITRQDKPDVNIGSIDADIDGIADMVGTITLNGKDTPFQGAQHSRVPPPPESTPGPQATETPY